MAGTTTTDRANTSANEVIDLTLSEDERVSPPITVTRFRPPSETSAGEPTEEAVPENALLPDREFGSFSSWRSGRPGSLLNRKVRKGGFSHLRRRITSKPFARSNECGSLPGIPQSQNYYSNSAKRRRVKHELMNHNHVREHDDKVEQNSRISQPNSVEKISGSGPLLLSSRSISAQAFQAPQQSRDEIDISKDTMNESLKIALRQQVFPHVNQYLSRYRLSIDNATRRQLGKRAAWEICGEDFMNNLMQNSGRLSRTFESKIAVMARSLIDQYAVQFVKASNKGRDDQVGTKPEFLFKKRHQIEPDNHCETRIGLEGSAEAARTSKKAKLSDAMKGRWARGEMDSAMIRKATTLLLKKAGQNTSSYNHGSSRIRKKKAFRQITLPNETSIPTVSCDDDGKVDKSRRQLIVRLRIREPVRMCPTPISQNGAQASRQRQCIAEIDGSNHSLRRSTRHSLVKGTKATALAMYSRSKNANCERTGGAKNDQTPVTLRRLKNAHHHMENLCLAGLVDHFPRPYLSWQHRNDIARGLALIQANPQSCAELSERNVLALQGSILHVDFCQEEVEFMMPAIRSIIGNTASPEAILPMNDIESLMRGREKIIPNILTALSAIGRTSSALPFRNRAEPAISAFLQDAATGLLSNRPEIKRFELGTTPSTDSVLPQDTPECILRQRETWGRRRNPRTSTSFKARLVNVVEDDYVRQAEWTDCSGDIATITWIDDSRFLCGATTHSDDHNMQYNKPGNLLVGSAVEKTLNSVSGHQIVRPIVTKGENSLAAMRGTQDPWMYCSVTTTAFSHNDRKCFTGSYDQTVKVWDISEDGSSMNLCGTWSHSGNVNFVVASQNHSLIATAADVREDAVRVYHFDPSNITASAFSIYEASVQRHNSSDTWAYFPSTMQWGISPSVSHLLLVGYSPRSFNCHDGDIPEEKLNSGELCLWDSRDGSRIPITSARTQNVFEVMWHPSQPIFVAATSPAGMFEDWVKTQLRVFEQKECGSFSHVKTLDCPAVDINEITIMPNSRVDSYVTASCTDGNTYVWDSALSDKPLHILRHSDSIDEYAHDETREETDLGVKFAAWGNSLGRFYTGSSDGVLKAWNIRAPPGHELIKDVIKLSGGISAGKFSPDFNKLLIGDSTGKVHLLSLLQVEASEGFPIALRKPITPHPPLLAPLIDDDDMEIPPEQTAKEIAQEFLARGQIEIHEDEWVGAIQGPNYATTGLFYNAEEYKNELGQDSEGWSSQELERKQQLRYSIELIKFPRLSGVQSSARLLHEKNTTLDLDVAALSPETSVQLLEAGIDLNFQDENNFWFELGSLIDDENANNFAKPDHYLDDNEIPELCRLKQQIQDELRIHKSLKNLF